MRDRWTLNNIKEKQNKLIYTLDIYIEYIHKVSKIIPKRVPTDKICTYFSMNKQFVKVGTKTEQKSYSIIKNSKMDRAISALDFNGEARNNVCTVQRTETKENGFLGMSSDTPQIP